MSIPATLKNVFDLLPTNAFRDKVVGMVATAGSAKHFLIPAQQLTPILTYMKAQVVQPYVFVEEKDLAPLREGRRDEHLLALAPA